MDIESSSDVGQVAPAVRSERERALGASQFPIDDLAKRVSESTERTVVRGLKGAMGAAVLCELERRLERPMLVVSADEAQLESLADGLQTFSGYGAAATLLIPEVDASPYSGIAPNRIGVAERLAACFRLTVGEHGPFVLASVDSLLRRVPPPGVLEGLSRVVSLGDEIELSALKRQLIDGGYAPVQLVEDPGTFAIRGGLVDVFSPTLEAPVRIEFWGDEVETLRTFDPRSQKSTGTIDAFFICPVREEIFTDETLETARARLRALADSLEFPTKSLRTVLADLEHGLHFLGIEALMPAFYEAPAEVLDLLPEDTVVVVLDPDACRDGALATWRKLEEQRQHRVADGELTFPVEESFAVPEAMLHQLEAGSWVAADPLLTDGDDDPIEFPCIENHDIGRLRAEQGAGEGTIKGLVKRLDEWRDVYGEIAIVARTRSHVDRLVSLLQGHGQTTRVLEPPIRLDRRPLPPAEAVHIYLGNLGTGARIPALSLALLTEADVFGPRARRRRSAQKEVVARHAVQSFQELKPGDHLVHLEHGIGRYEGLHKLDIDGRAHDFLLIQYSGDDKLYLPVYRLASVSKYSGDQPRRVDKLGGSAWDRTKEKVKARIKEMAVDLLRVYAERQLREGYAFPPPDDYYHEFEATFPFDETPDQLSAIDEVVTDMTRRRPMDRLICGDVGFGKTEVAIRAAFLAICAGKQVAVLVPTTILAEQHLSTFRTRLSGYPVRVESLSRFRSSQESAEIKRDMAAGKVDVVIGTHRLLGKQIEWKQLGLLVVDEEHRFGVGHKEKIKQLAATIDVLTMTATPIPRTLQMSLFGIRDLTLIATPPQDRLAVRTHIAKYGRDVIREAIMAELTRGGQVFFLHNRVQTIEQMASRLREWVPEARVGIAHGQMDERRLERVMLQFVRGEINVLLATTIIESGLDIPNANCLIVNRADRLGLAQLYQLRGRVGRSSQRAHCYLLIPGQSAITGDARERLDAITRFTDLGSGFEIAQFDLELRGAGNLLGPEQSGNVAAVGIELYSELLEEAIAELKGEYHAPAVEPEVNLPLEAYLPDDYIVDVQLRLLFYKRLSTAADANELFAIYEEVRDRFGEPPEMVENLRHVFEVKLLVRRMSAAGVDVNNTAVILNIGEHSLLDPQKVVALVTTDRRFQLRPDMRLVRYLTKSEAEDVLGFAKRYLHDLAEAVLLS